MSLEFPIPSVIGQSLPFDNRLWVWDGIAWRSQGVASQIQSTLTAAVRATLTYVIAAGTSSIVIFNPDANGLSYVLEPTGPAEPVDVHVNGLRQTRDFNEGAGGDYLVNRTTSAITFNTPLEVGDVVLIDILIPPAYAVLGSVNIHPVLDLDIDWGDALQPAGLKDGIRTNFEMWISDGAGGYLPANAIEPEHIEVFVDGVRQRISLDYTTTGPILEMVVAPRADAEFWALWYEPAGEGSGGVHLPLAGGTMVDGAGVTFDTTTAQAGAGAATQTIINGDGGRIDNVVIDGGTF